MLFPAGRLPPQDSTGHPPARSRRNVGHSHGLRCISLDRLDGQLSLSDVKLLRLVRGVIFGFDFCQNIIINL